MDTTEHTCTHTHMCKIESKWNSCIAQGAQLELCDDLEKWDGRVEGEAQEGGDTCIIIARGPDPSSKATLLVKAQHEGVLTSPCIVWKNTQIPNTD